MHICIVGKPTIILQLTGQQLENTVVLPLSIGDIFEDPQWMSETMDSTEPYAYCVFSYT